MKRRYVLSVFLIVLVLAASAPFAGATAVMTSTEKENKYTAAILNLESYLESYGDTSISLLGIEEEFSQLRGYEQSRQLMNYTKVLSKIEQEEFDYDVTRLLLSLDDNKVFKAYLADVLKGSPISTVEDLKTYTAGRKCEKEGQVEEAIRYYTECLNYFDADIRRDRLSLGQTNAAYDRAVTLLNNGDFAGAYYEFEEISYYNDSKEYQDSIVKLIGYKPASAMDNPEAVGVINAEAGSDYIELSWARPAHVTRYRVGIREQGQTTWTMKECYEDSIHWDGLAPESIYVFQIIAVSGEAEMAPAMINVMTTQRVTPAPTSVPTPTPTPTPSSEYLTLSWNASQNKWDLFLKGQKLSCNPDTLKTEVDAVFGEPSITYDTQWEWFFENSIRLYFDEKVFDKLTIQNAKSGYQCLALIKNFTSISEAKEYITSLHHSHSAHYCLANTLKDGKSVYSSYNPDTTDGMQALLSEKEGFRLFYTYAGSMEYWSSRFSIRCEMTESDVQVCIVFPLDTTPKIVGSGQCGKNVNWSLDENGILIIAGIGETWDYDYYPVSGVYSSSHTYSPWYSYEWYTKRINRVVIEDGVTSIGDGLFYSIRMEHISIPESVTSIGDGAFKSCNYLTSVSIPKSVTSIGEEVFRECSELSSIMIPSGITSISDYAFEDCDGLHEIVIPNNVQSIGRFAFEDCDNLTKITIPNSVTSIGDNPFAKCFKLENIEIASDHPAIRIYDGALFNSDMSELICYLSSPKRYSYSVPQGVTVIGYAAFWGCKDLRFVTLPDGVRYINDIAFSECEKLSDINIPNSVTKIDRGAFSECNSLKEISIPQNTTIDVSTFYMTSVEITRY